MTNERITAAELFFTSTAIGRVEKKTSSEYTQSGVQARIFPLFYASIFVK